MTDSSLQEQLKKALAEISKLRQENESLKSLLAVEEKAVYLAATPVGHQILASTVSNDSPTEEKIALFRQLFVGRSDVFAVRWENKTGKSGYIPACRNEWNRPLCRKPTIKCAQCENRDFLQFTDQVVLNHLTGKHTIGIYPLLSIPRR